MKNIFLSILGVVAVCSINTVSFAQSNPNQLEVQNFDNDALIDETRRAENRDRLRHRYNISEERLLRVENTNLSPSERRMVISLASQLPGGATERNIQQVLQARNRGSATQSWSTVANSLGINYDRAMVDYRGPDASDRRFTDNNRFDASDPDLLDTPLRPQSNQSISSRDRQANTLYGR